MTDTPRLFISLESPDVPVPERAHADDSGIDLRAWKFDKAVRCLHGMYEELVDPDDEGYLPTMSPTEDSVLLNPGERVLVNTGIRATVVEPEGTPTWARFDISIVSRSGTPFKEGLFVANQPGTVDVSYRGVIKVALLNASATAKTIKRGDRIAQLVIRPVAILPAEVVEALPPLATGRGEGGFGSSGKS